jgi:hypothetical protein
VGVGITEAIDELQAVDRVGGGFEFNSLADQLAGVAGDGDGAGEDQRGNLGVRDMGEEGRCVELDAAIPEGILYSYFDVVTVLGVVGIQRGLRRIGGQLGQSARAIAAAVSGVEIGVVAWLVCDAGLW